MSKLSLIPVLVEAAVADYSVQVAADYFAVPAVEEPVAIAADYYSAVQVVGYSEQAAVADYFVEQVVAVDYYFVDYYFLQST